MAGGYRHNPQGVQGLVARDKAARKQDAELRRKHGTASTVLNEGDTITINEGATIIINNGGSIDDHSRDITNLCTDPKPADLLTWLTTASPMGNPATADSTYPGTAFRVDTSTFSYGTPFALPSTGPLVNLMPDNQSPAAPLTSIVPLDGDLGFAFNLRTADTFTVYAGLSIYDASGTLIASANDSGVSGCIVTQSGRTLNTVWVASLGTPGYDLPAGASTRVWFGVDKEAVLALEPDAAYVQFRFTNGQPIVGGTSPQAWLGNGSIYAGSDIVAYGGGDSPGWIDNGDGTSTGPAPESIDWDQVDHPDLFPPEPHTHVAANITDFLTAVRANRLDQMATPTANVSLGTKKITSLGDPTSAQDAATKAYVDASTVQLTATWNPADDTAMIALAAKKGDLALKADDGQTYVLAMLPASTLGNWVAIGGSGGGSSIVPTGEWDSATAYAVNDSVSLDGTSYLAIVASTNQSPDTSPTYWQVLAGKGDAGAAGVVASVVAGAGVTVDSTDPANPVVSATGGGGGGGSYLGDWAAGTYNANDLVAFDAVLWAARTTTTDQPELGGVPTTTVGGSDWSRNSVSSTPSTNEVILVGNTTNDFASVCSNSTFSGWDGMTLSADISMSGTADAMQIGILNAASAATSLGTVGPGGMEGISGFCGIEFDLFNNRIRAVVAGVQVTTGSFNTTPDTVGYETWQVLMQDLGTTWKLTVSRATAGLVTTFTVTKPAFTSYRLAVGAWSGGSPGTFKVRGTPKATIQSADWRRLSTLIDVA